MSSPDDGVPSCSHRWTSEDGFRRCIACGSESLNPQHGVEVGGMQKTSGASEDGSTATTTNHPTGFQHAPVRGPEEAGTSSAQRTSEAKATEETAMRVMYEGVEIEYPAGPPREQRTNDAEAPHEKVNVPALIKKLQKLRPVYEVASRIYYETLAAPGENGPSWLEPLRQALFCGSPPDVDDDGWNAGTLASAVGCATRDPLGGAIRATPPAAEIDNAGRVIAAWLSEFEPDVLARDIVDDHIHDLVARLLPRTK